MLEMTKGTHHSVILIVVHASYQIVTDVKKNRQMRICAHAHTHTSNYLTITACRVG